MSRNLGFLWSFAFYRNADLAELRANNPAPFVMGDSGAFSALYSGNPVTIDDYDEWLLKWDNVIDASPCFDVIGDATATRRNLDRQVADGLSPIPVWHFGSPLDELRRLLDDGFGYIALGNTPQPTKRTFGVWNTVFELGRDAGAVYHLFGQMNKDLLRAFPFYSADSSSWDSYSRFGILTLYDPAKRHVIMVKPKMEPRKWLDYWHIAEDQGHDPNDFVNGEAPHWKSVLVPCMRAYARWADSLAKTHGPVHNPALPDIPGPLLVLAVVGKDHMPHVEVTL